MKDLIDAGIAVGAPTAADAAVASAATKTMAGGTAMAGMGVVSSNHGMAVAGFVLTILGFIVNLLFRLRRDRREQELQKARLDDIAYVCRRESCSHQIRVASDAVEEDYE